MKKVVDLRAVRWPGRSGAKATPGKAKSAAPRELRPLRIGVALGGGMARGWAHIGALKALESLGLAPHVIAGTSIGAVCGAAFACNRLALLEEWVLGLKTFTFWKHMRLRAVDGLFTSTQLGRIMEERLGRIAIEDMARPFGCVASDLGTGQEVWLRSGDLIEAVRASYAIPGFFAPVAVDGHWLADGALVNPVPVTLARALGADVVIAISLSGDGLPGSWQRSDVRGQPNLFGSIATAFNIMQHRLNGARLAGDPPDIQVNIDTQAVGLMDFHRGADLIAVGDAAIRAAQPKIEAAVHLLEGTRLLEHPEVPE